MMKIRFNETTISLIVVLIIFGTTNAQDLSLNDYRWSLLETTGEVTGRHENAFIEFQDKFYLMALNRKGILLCNYKQAELNKNVLL